jgi:hypothetical protein
MHAVRCSHAVVKQLCSNAVVKQLCSNAVVKTIREGLVLTFACFASAKVQTLTPEEVFFFLMPGKADRERRR